MRKGCLLPEKQQLDFLLSASPTKWQCPRRGLSCGRRNTLREQEVVVSETTRSAHKSPASSVQRAPQYSPAKNLSSTALCDTPSNQSRKRWMPTTKIRCGSWNWLQQDGSTQKLSRCKQEDSFGDRLCAAVWPPTVKAGSNIYLLTQG